MPSHKHRLRRKRAKLSARRKKEKARAVSRGKRR